MSVTEIRNRSSREMRFLIVTRVVTPTQLIHYFELAYGSSPVSGPLPAAA